MVQVHARLQFIIFSIKLSSIHLSGIGNTRLTSGQDFWCYVRETKNILSVQKLIIKRITRYVDILSRNETSVSVNSILVHTI